MVKFLKIAAGLLAGMVSLTAVAQDFPTKPIRLIVPFGAGGPTDLGARLVAEGLGARLGQPVIVENRPGAQGRIGTELIAAQAPDGYSFGFVASTLPYLPVFFKDWKRDLMGSYTYVGSVSESTTLIVGPATLPVKNLGELLDFYKARPGTLNIAYTAPGPWELLFEYLNRKYSLQATRIPYKSSGEARLAAAAGDVHLVTEGGNSAGPDVRSGRLKAWGIMAPKRSANFPDVPTLTEAVKTDFKFDQTPWYGLIGPANLPQAITDKVNRALNEVVRDPAFGARVRPLGMEPMPGTPADFRERVRLEVTQAIRLGEEFKIEKQ